MNTLLVVEKYSAESGHELVQKGYSENLLTTYLRRQEVAARNAVFHLRPATPDDDLENVASINALVIRKA